LAISPGAPSLPHTPKNQESPRQKGPPSPNCVALARGTGSSYSAAHIPNRPRLSFNAAHHLEFLQIPKTDRPVRTAILYWAVSPPVWPEPRPGPGKSASIQNPLSQGEPRGAMSGAGTGLIGRGKVDMTHAVPSGPRSPGPWILTSLGNHSPRHRPSNQSWKEMGSGSNLGLNSVHTSM
jgi:hypothetical protein